MTNQVTQNSVEIVNDSWLMDHRVSSVSILPGASLMMAVIEQSSLGRPSRVTEAKFTSMSPLVAGQTNKLTVEVSGHEVEIISIKGEDGTELATMTVEPFVAWPSPLPTSAPGRTATLAAAEIYERLARNGNDYGSGFQGLHSATIDGESVEADWVMPAGATDPLVAVLDLAVQALGLVQIERRRPFLLSGFAQAVVGSEVLDRGRVRSRLVETSAGQIVGDVDVLDEAGLVVHSFRGVTLGYQNERQGSQSDTTSVVSLVSSFTAEPIEESIDFWARQLGWDMKVSFSPYGQVFQELLDPNSNLSQGSKAVALIRTQDFSRADASHEETHAPFPAELDTFLLADGREIVHLNEYETRYLQMEIFADQAYLRHGITMSDGDVIVDIGANIGLFSLFASSQADDLEIYAYEPSPVVYPILKANLARYAPKAVAIEAGAGGGAGTAELSFYPRSSVFSGFAPNSENDEAALRAIVANSVRERLGSHETDVEALVDELMADRLEVETHTCRIESVSELIAREGLTRIDLLKVDAEKSERQILSGITDDDWPKIKQIVVEVHDQDGEGIEDVCDLLRARGFEVSIEEEELLTNSGLYNLFGTRPGQTQATPVTVDELDRDRIASATAELHGAIAAFVDRGRTLDLVFCQPTALSEQDAAWIADHEQALARELGDVPGLHVVTSAELSDLYPVALSYDEVGDRLGHIPYTRDGFAAAGTTVARGLHLSSRPPAKVVVLDCDNTLWAGAVGEVGVEGVGIEAGHRALQQWALDLAADGVLICLCSKNETPDVQQVFESRQDMVLGWDDVVAHRINWQPKSTNLGELAATLDLGLDSFVFIDDNPVEVAEVRTALPQVTALTLPEDQEDLGSWLRHIWPIDRAATTAEDTNRTQMYRDAATRSEFQSETNSLQDFIDGLDLEISIFALDESLLPRAAQLTQRTNQFNTTTVRRTENELTGLVDDGRTVELVSAKDRFGDYGTIGLVVYNTAEASLTVDSFMLSCRVLGRGVEHRVVAHLGEVASARGCESVAVRFEASDRNTPVAGFLAFLDQTPETDASGDSWYRIGASSAAELRYDADSVVAASDEVARNVLTAGTVARSAVYELIAGKYRSMTEVALRAGERVKVPRPNLEQPFEGPKSDLEKRLAGMWADVLGLEEVGVKDEFFDLGGTSLLAVEMVAQLQGELALDVDIVDLFEARTVDALAKVISGEDDSAQRVDASKDRGASRRSQAGRRRSRSGR